MSQDKKQSLIGGAMILTLGGIIVKIVGYLYNIPITDIWLKADGMGFYNSVYNSLYLPVYTLALSGFPTAIAKIVSGLNAQHKYNDIKTVKKAATRFFMCLGIGGTLLILLVSRIYVNQVIQNPLAFYCVLAVAPSIFFSALLAAKRGFDQGMRNMTTTAVSQVIEVLAKTVFGLAATYFTLSALTREYESAGTVAGQLMASATDARNMILALSAAAAMLAVTVSVAVGYLYFVIRSTRAKDSFSQEQYLKSPESLSQKHYVKLIFMIGFPIALSSLVATFTQLIDAPMLQRLINNMMESNPEALYAAYGGLLDGREPEMMGNFLYGCFTAYSQKLYGLIPTLTAAFSVSALPLISEMWASKDKVGTEKGISSLMRMTTFISAPLGFGMCALAGPILSFVFSNSSVEVQVATDPLMIIAGLAFISACSTPIFCILNAVGRIDIPIKLTLVASVIKIGLTWFLVSIPSINIMAAAYSNAAFYAFIFVAGALCIKKYVGYKISIFKVILKPAIAGALCGAFALLAYNLLPGGRTSTIIAIFVGMVVYIAATVIMRVLPREDIEALPGGRKLANVLTKIGALEASANED